MRSLLLVLLVIVVATLSTRAGSPSSEGPGASEAGWVEPTVEQILPGVWRVRFGTPERFTPGAIRESAPRATEMERLARPTPLPFEPGQIRCRISPSHTVISVPCDEPGEQIYGFGLDPGAY